MRRARLSCGEGGAREAALLAAQLPCERSGALPASWFLEGERKSKGERGQGTGRWHTRQGGGGRWAATAAYRPMAASIALRQEEDKGVEVQLLLFESFGGFGKGVREILWKAANVLQNKLVTA